MEEHAKPRAGTPRGQDDQTGIRRRLGRGLNALLSGSAVADEESHLSESTPTTPTPTTSNPDPTEIHIDLIERNPYQPRTEFEQEALRELSESIKQHGILQPILVRSHEGHYQIIAGERRWLAARQAGLEAVPCRVLELEDRQVCEVAIEENLKRKDLNVLEKAQAFQDYISRFDSTMEELAKRLSMNRSTLSNYLRLLELSDPVKKALSSDKISNGHARALLSLNEADQISLCQRIQGEGLSVRKTEEAVRALLKGEPDSSTIPFPAEKPADQSNEETPEMTNHLVSLQEQLRNLLGVKVEIRLTGKDAGKITIPFHNSQEFEQIVRQFHRSAA